MGEADGKVLAELLQAASGLLWPLLAAFVVWKLYPSLRKVIESRSFTIKVAGMEITAQEATDKLRQQINDLQDKVEELRRGPAPLAFHAAVPAAAPAAAEKISELTEEELAQAEAETDEALAEIAAGAEMLDIDKEALASVPPRRLRRVLWVDDTPSNNFSEIARLKDDEVTVDLATSTDEALRLLNAADWRVDAVITDLGRVENGRYRGDAGLRLVEAVRQRGAAPPVIAYSTPRGVRANAPLLARAGASGWTSSSVELFETLKGVV